MIFSNFKPKKSPFFPFLLEKWTKIHKIDDFGYKKSSKFEGNSMINSFSLVPQIDHPVALCLCALAQSISCRNQPLMYV